MIESKHGNNSILSSLKRRKIIPSTAANTFQGIQGQAGQGGKPSFCLFSTPKLDGEMANRIKLDLIRESVNLILSAPEKCYQFPNQLKVFIIQYLLNLKFVPQWEV